ncbi:MAG: sulfatase activating formylglycine-generating enzyme [Halioglobus sp.]|jgi:formylglycine-generating enzyme required for sulfatase activity
MSDNIQASTFEPLNSADAPPPATGKPIRWVALGIGIIFLAIMAFLLTAKSLQINIESLSPAEVELSGGLLLPFGDRYLLRPGEYMATAKASGYHDLHAQIIVTDKDSQIVQLMLQPLPGKLSISSAPAGARVLLDSEFLAETPFIDLPVEAGDHYLEIHAPRYLSLQRELAVTGREVQQKLDLTLAPAWAEITIGTEPAGATILVDGEDAGTTPAVVEVLRGEAQIMLKKDTFASYLQDITVIPGVPQNLGTIKLTAAAGVVELSSAPSGANVTLDGEFQGQTPLTLEVTPERSHRLAVFKAGYKRHASSLEMSAGESASRTIKLSAMLGEVKFNISPSMARLKVNGKTRGAGSSTLSLPAVSQSVEVSLEGYATVRQRVTPRQGLQQVVNITLQTAREAQLARIKPEITTSMGQTLLLFSPAESGHGDFALGASRRDPGRRANEVLHPVSLTRMFYMQTTEVSNAQFRLFQSDHNSGQIEGNSLNREHQPVVQISWQQAAQYCNWLSKREGLPPFYRQSKGIVIGHTPSATGYRLPTEAEWAWTARMGSDGTLKKFPWGDEFPPTSAVENYADNTSAYVTGRILDGYTDGNVVSATVASFPPSGNGLYDMGGNVAEWIHDVYSIPAANSTVAIDPSGGQSGDNYVIRGASWTQSKIGDLRLSHRDYGQAGRDDVGFRIARYAE